ncbi:hydrolase/acyltransferase [Ammoniphilus sp. CFH 90114]|uniref:hydrolase/acyltransferase n=1 Tax=Ammoniphilus sp. CFH 90114 TaxID=2493665 RepID=UPI00100E98E5|nr:hydrolase/acyltransferase [Ammoniphilus sp. CFH 90114]RXT05196.1 hydrolase/acyltransferase [Ammoniphilus sp. CFH 90114]
MRFCILQGQSGLEFVAIPKDHMYQFVALFRRLHKEIDKLTAGEVPTLPSVIAECSDLEMVSYDHEVVTGLDYINRLEATFVEIQEENYPLISLLTEIRAFQAQLEYLAEEEEI